MRRKDFELDYWPSVADFMLGLFILAITTGTLLLIVQRLQTLSPLGGTILTVPISVDRLAELEKAEKERNDLRRKPKIIVIDEADRFNFKSGSPEIAIPFRAALQQTYFPKLVQTIEEFPTVNTIEVIGHTDSATVTSRSNLDRNLIPFLNGQIGLGLLTPGSNADLGLLRALAVRAEWNAWLQSPAAKLSRPVTVRCYSAANSAPLDARKLGAGRDDQTRRIEIRFTELKQ